MFEESGRLHRIGMLDDELLILRGSIGVLTERFGAKGAVEHGDRHRLAFVAAEREPVAARELRVGRGAARELRDHLAFGDLDPAERHREAELGRGELDLHFALTHLAGEGVIVPEPPLRRIGEAEEESFVAARERLEPLGAGVGMEHEVARDVARLGVVRGARPVVGGLHERVGCRAARVLPHGGVGGVVGAIDDGGERPGQRPDRLVGEVVAMWFDGIAGIEAESGGSDEPMGVVERGAEALTAGDVLVGGRDAPGRRQRGRVDRLGRAESRQGRAVGADEGDRLDGVALALQDRLGGELRIVERSLGHDARDEEAQGVGELFGHDRRRARGMRAPRDEFVCGRDRPLAALDRDVHQRLPAASSTRVVRGSPTTSAGAAVTKKQSIPSGNGCSSRPRSSRMPAAVGSAISRSVSIPGPESR